MTGRKKKPEESGISVPLWIVSFSDMVTLLLSFFVLLQALARTRDPELFFLGQGSFLRAIHNFGLPGWLLGRKEDYFQQHIKVRHSAESDPETVPPNRSIDAEDESIRMAFDQLRESLDTRTSERPLSRPHVVVADILFRQGRTELDDPARRWLVRFAASLNESRRPETMRIAVFGRGDPHEAEGPSKGELPLAAVPAGPLDLAAARADAVADYLVRALPGGAERWTLEAVGTTPDGMIWEDLSGPRRESFILIVLEEKRGDHG